MAKGRAVWSISPEATVYEAIDRMSVNSIGALVVLSAENLVGIISERDYARKVILKGRQSRETRVREIMSMPVFCVAPQGIVARQAPSCISILTLFQLVPKAL